MGLSYQLIIPRLVWLWSGDFSCAHFKRNLRIFGIQVNIILGSLMVSHYWFRWWLCAGNKPSPEPMWTQFYGVNRPQWVNCSKGHRGHFHCCHCMFVVFMLYMLYCVFASHFHDCHCKYTTATLWYDFQSELNFLRVCVCVVRVCVRSCGRVCAGKT